MAATVRKLGQGHILTDRIEDATAAKLKAIISSASLRAANEYRNKISDFTANPEGPFSIYDSSTLTKETTDKTRYIIVSVQTGNIGNRYVWIFRQSSSVPQSTTFIGGLGSEGGGPFDLKLMQIEGQNILVEIDETEDGQIYTAFNLDKAGRSCEIIQTKGVYSASKERPTLK